MTGTGEFEARLHKIRERFVASLPERVQQAEEAFAAAGRTDQDNIRDDIEALRFFAHDLAGIAPGLGFSALGQRGQLLEKCVVECLEHGGSLDETNAQEISKHLQAIRQISRGEAA
jgi:HPt (histidine-containing phosphotransfer) domain-containing protein